MAVEHVQGVGTSGEGAAWLRMRWGSKCGQAVDATLSELLGGKIFLCPQQEEQ